MSLETLLRGRSSFRILDARGSVLWGGRNQCAYYRGTGAGFNGDFSPSRRVSQLFCFSARTDLALQSAASNLGKALSALCPTDLADAAYTLAKGRRAFAKRAWVVAPNGAEAERAFASIKNQQTARARPRFAFAFPGQGSQYAAMGRALAEVEPIVKEQLRRCFEVVDRLNSTMPSGDQIDLRRVLDPSPDTLEEAKGAFSANGIHATGALCR